MNFLALKLIQYLLATGSIENLDTGSYFAINLVNFLALKLIQYLLPTGSIKNLDTGSYFCHKFGEISSTKVDSTCDSYWFNEILIHAHIYAIKLVNFLALQLIQYLLATGSIENHDTGSYFCHKFGEFSSTKVDSTCTSYWVN